MSTMFISSKGADSSTTTTIRDLEYIINAIKEDNFDMKKNLTILEKYMEINECENCLYFEVTKRIKRLWITNGEYSFRFIIWDLKSIFDLSFPVNYHKNGGHILLFDNSFDELDHLKQLKNIISTIFKSKNSVQIERVLVFYYYDEMISLRNYLIKDVTEIGPRLDLKLDRIFKGCFKGERIYSNLEDTSDNK